MEALRGLDLELRSRVTFFVGENGSGKSTLLEEVARCCGFNVQGDGRDHQARMPDGGGDDLAPALRLSRTPTPSTIGSRRRSWTSPERFFKHLFNDPNQHDDS